MDFKLDSWQKEVLNTEGNICLRSGRQVGKSTIISIKAGEYAMNNSKKVIMVIAKVERQAQLLFEKILAHIFFKNRTLIKKGKDRPTKHQLKLKNGSVIHCLPCGDTGYGIMGYTINLLIADEAAFIPEEVWTSITPALAVARGTIWLLSTPFIKEGYYYNCFSDPKFTAFHTSSEDCPRKDDKFLEHQKAWMTKAQYAQMYLGEFRDEFARFISEELIKKCCILPENKLLSPKNDYFLGVDIARMGEDESTFEILDGTNKERIIQIESIVTTKTLLTETTRKIISLNTQYNFNQIGLDDGGMGVGVFDQLLEEDDIKRKVIALNNAKRSIDNEEGKKKLMKEDMYNNLLRLMERGEIKLLDDDEVKASLRSIQGEHNPNTGRLIISGEDTHIAEGLIRGTWCIKTKSLNPYIN